MALQSGSLGDVRGPDYTRMAVRRMWRDARRRKDGAGMLKALDEAEARGSTVSGSVTEDQDTAMRNAAAQAGRRSQMIEAMVVKSMRDRLQAGKKGLGTSTASKTVPEAPSSSAVSPDSTTTEYKPEGSTKTTALLGDEGAAGPTGGAGSAGTPAWATNPDSAWKPKPQAPAWVTNPDSAWKPKPQASAEGSKIPVRNMSDQETADKLRDRLNSQVGDFEGKKVPTRVQSSPPAGFTAPFVPGASRGASRPALTGTTNGSPRSMTTTPASPDQQMAGEPGVGESLRDLVTKPQGTAQTPSTGTQTSRTRPSTASPSRARLLASARRPEEAPPPSPAPSAPTQKSEMEGAIPWRKGQEPAKAGEWFNADTGQVETGPRPAGYKEVGISGSGDRRRTSYAKDTTTAPMRSSEDMNRQRLEAAYARKRDIAEALRTPGGMDMVRRNRAREAAAKAADARATEEQVTKDLYGQADINEATMRRMNPDEPVRKPSVQSRTRREKQILDEINKRKQRAAMIRRFGA